MTERVTIGDATLIHGDAYDVLAELGIVDAIVSDPPYGIAHVKGNGGKGKHTRRNIAPIIGDDRPFDPNPIIAAARESILWGCDHYYPRLPDSGRWLVWDKLEGRKPWDSFCDVEFAWHSEPGAARITSHLWKGICANKTHEDSRLGKRHHPTQKPIAVMRWCIEQLRDKTGTVVDPFMGSGTTGVAAVQLGRRFIGVELDRAYFDVAVQRITAAHAAKEAA